MNNIKQKIASDYWFKKIKNTATVYANSLERSQIANVYIEGRELSYFEQLTKANPIAEYTILLSIYSALLNRYFEADTLIYTPKITDGNGTLLLYNYATEENTFKEYLQILKKEVQEVYKFADHDNQLGLAHPLEAYATYGFLYNASETEIATPFCLCVDKNDQGIKLSISFDANFVNETIAGHFLETFKRWLITLDAILNTKITTLSIVTEAEEKQLLHDFNATALAFPQHETLIDLFEQQVEKTPESIAVVHNDVSLTYAELNEKASQFANYLITVKKVASGDYVGIKLERNQHLLIAILGTLKVGATYVPIDVNYPEDRINYIEKDSGCICIVDAVMYGEFAKESTTLEIQNKYQKFSSNNTAYIIYTSGTTGNPKGVMISHKNAVALIYWAKKEFDQAKFDVVYAVTSHCFDLSIYELFFPLATGKKIRILKNALHIEKTIANDTNVLINTVPSSIRSLLDNSTFLKNTSMINLAGEPFPVDIANTLKTTSIEVRNLYGPSEDTTYSTFYKIQSQKTYQNSIPVGKPIANTQAYILDDALQLVPVGVSGKLYLSGEGLAKGYLNKPALTDQKFIENPFVTNAKMYDTGDIAKWTSEGIIEFLGRKDYQVKLRGYRIELGEIENTIRTFSDNIVEAVTIVKNQSLIAFYEEKAMVERAELIAFLKKKLPVYMQPNLWMRLSKIPLTPNGKTDRKQLLELVDTYKSQNEYIAPENSIEEELVRIWQEVLNIQKIGVQDNFFELGGQSLLIIQIINTIYKELDKTISFEKFSENPTIRAISNLLIEKKFESIAKITPQPNYELTASQHRIWILSQLEGGNIAYNMHGAVVLKGKLDIEKLEKAFQQLVYRHEILRTYFTTHENGTIYQAIVPKEEIQFEIAILDFEDKKQELAAYLETAQESPFDLTKAPLLKASLLKQASDVYVFSFVKHHIIGDGWSMELLISEVISNYNQLLLNDQFTPEELPLQFKDYVAWFDAQKSQEEYQTAQRYWLEQFQGEIPVLELPSFKKRPAIQTYHGKTVNHAFSKEFLGRIKQFSKENEATLFMTLMVGINTLLYRYTNQEDIIIGTPIAGREHPDLEDQIGLYLNTLAVRTQLEDTFNFEELLQQQKQVLLQAYKHQRYPFDELVSKLDLKRDTSRSALFDVIVVLQNQHQIASISSENKALEGVEVLPYELERNTAQVDVSFTFVEKNDALYLEIEYNTDIYDAFLITRMFSHFENILNHAIDAPKEKLLTLEYLTEQESKQIVEEFNDTSVAYPKEKTILHVFEEQVEKTPENTAIVFEDSELTYAQLNKKANQLADYLQKNQNIQLDDLVAIKLDRSENLLVAILGILKSGAAYVPIDTNYPQQRIEYIENDSNAKVVIDSLFFETFENEKEAYSIKNTAVKAAPNNLAYIIYTSGTTGNPKGAMISNASLLDYTLTFKNYFGVTEKDRSLQQASLSFDTSIEEIFPILISGGTLIMLKEHSEFDLLANICEQHRVTILSTNPYALQFLNQSYKNYNFSFRILISGGDILKPEYIDKLYLDYQVFNTYGPTESTVCSTYYEVKTLSETIPIGKPIANRTVLIVDANNKNQIQPIGVKGELCILGKGLSLGYLNKSDLTDEKFVNSILSEDSKMYTSGDVARWLPDGNIEFLGRNDDQVKIRGYRIELGEIESTLHEFSKDFTHITVLVKQVNDEKMLVAYYASASEIEKTKLKNFLSEKLPDYMVPSFFVQLKNIPLTLNGKIDKRKLPDIAEEDIIKNPYIAPKNQTEEELVSIWKQLLEIETIGTQDDFFELGGHSLKITKLKNSIEQAFNISMSFSDLFLKTTISAQANHILTEEKESYQEIPKVAPQAYYELSSAQQRIWILSQFEGSNEAYNMPGVFQLTGAIDAAKLENAFEQLLKRHESLRTQFVLDASGAIQQHILSETDCHFKLIQETIEDESQQRQAINELVSHAFHLEKAPLIRTKLIKTAEGNYLFVFVIHHIVSDGWSIDILKNELFYLYNQKESAQEGLPALRIQYKDYAVWERNQLTSPKLEASKAYWISQFSGELPVIDLPYKTRRPQQKTYAGAKKEITISKEKLVALQSKCTGNQATLFMGLMGIVNVLLHRYTRQKDIIIGTPIAGRTHADVQHQIGVYINTLPIRTQIQETDSFQDILARIKTTTLKAYKHQAYPFDILIDDLSIARDLSRNPLFDIMVTLQNTDEEKLQENKIANVQVERYSYTDAIAAKFDLDFMFEETKNGLEFALVYNTDLFSETFITALTNQFVTLTDGIIEDVTKNIASLPILTPQQEQQLLLTFNDTQTDLDEEKTVLDYIQHQVEKHPENSALKDAHHTLSYETLDQLSNGIANYLIQTLGTNTHPVGVVLDRSVNTIVLLLGILKSGKSYIPLDPTFPLERLKYIVQHSGIETVVGNQAFTAIQDDNIQWLTIENILVESKKVAETQLPVVTAAHGAYIIYTSGSTGNPKGVAVGHASLSNFLLSMQQAPGFSSEDTLYAVTTYAFDISILEFFLPLISGGTTYIASNDTLMDVEEIMEELTTVQPTVIQATPSFYQLLFNAGWEGNSALKVLCGGDALNESLAQQLVNTCQEVWNMYGPTETTIWSTTKKVTQGNISSSIGKPIANTQCYVLDKNLQLLPEGAQGDLYIGGKGLALGYYKNETLTSERFIKNPFGDGLIYNTGDCVAWNPNGELSFYGRNDYQVKVRGYRIELGDIETHINAIEAIQQAVVLVKKDKADQSILVAYYVASTTVEITKIKNLLKEALPAYMIPAVFVEINDFPLTPNKKVDRKALLSRNDALQVQEAVYVAPQTETESKLAELWSTLLSQEKIGRTANFFDLGGHSLSSAKLVSLIQNEFSVKLTINKIFEYPDLESMANHIDNIVLIQLNQNQEDIETEFENFSI
ncbi:non-ribosomal peptide synthetase [uncultured Kordia sp.]|uniref:non-ribosomal peptide synthetase n=1 Tax=uncultured Kordia sp. TaxID=507699 RepID=UPI0026208301|nr:non-ribosomal peptide synthetase [uncultured Kordia sp.]